MNGAEAIARTLVDSGVDACFMNPGTSEMQFVAALDDVPALRSILVLFEGVASGAADGYGRMARRPAATLLHLGPGLSNASANLHNARRARTPMVNLVGEHARSHLQYDSPLQSDIEALARPVSDTVHRIAEPEDVGPTIAAAVRAANGPPSGVATVIVPADLTWQPDIAAAPRHPRAEPVAADPGSVAHAREALVAGRSALLLGGAALDRESLTAAAGVTSLGSKAFFETFPARLTRGPDLFQPERLAYFGEQARAQLDGLSNLVVVDARVPVTFFGYPNQPSTVLPEGCNVIHLDTASLRLLAEEVRAEAPRLPRPTRPPMPTGPLTSKSVAAAVAVTLPENAVVVDEGNTAGRDMLAATAGVVDHDWLTLTGGSIGIGAPLAVGAAIACPDRPVLCLEADGSALYTVQALWTMAREQLDVTMLLLDNQAYGILRVELARVGASTPGPLAARMLDLDDPPIDFVRVAQGLGVQARPVDTAEDLTTALARAYAEPGPHLIQVAVR